MPDLRVLVFLSVFTALSLALHRYVWVRCVRDVGASRRTRRVTGLLAIGLALLVVVGITLWRAIGSEAALPISWVGAVWTGAVFLIAVCLAGSDLLRAVARRTVLRHAARRASRVVDPSAPELSRRAFLGRTVAGVAGAGGVTLSALAVADAAGPPDIVNVDVPIEGLPAAFEGYRIAHLTDLHVGPLLRRPFLEDLVARTNAIGADLIALTGDLVDGSVDELRSVVDVLAELRARDGVVACTGNHEYYVGADPWVAHLHTLGVRTLRNERMAVEREGAFIDVAGIDDPTGARTPGHGPDLAAALKGQTPGRPVVLLAHQPKAVREAEHLGVALQLSGHTHGGQIAPFGWLVRFAQPAVAGLHRFGPTWLYVNRGAGTWGPPMRLGNPAEIARVTLRRA